MSARCARQYSSMTTVKLLLKYGADPKIKDNFGFDTLKAAYSGDSTKQTIELLKKYDIDNKLN